MFDFKRWFGIAKHERGWVATISAAFFFLIAANAILFSILQSFLIKRAGIEYLPYFYVCSSIMLSVSAAVAFGPLRKLRTASQGMVMSGIATVGAALLAIAENFITPGAGLVSVFAFAILGLFVNSVAVIGTLDKMSITESDVFNVEQLQRLDPFITGASTVSGAVGGLLLAWISEGSSTIVPYLVVLFLLICSTYTTSILVRKVKAERLMSSFNPGAVSIARKSFKERLDPFQGQLKGHLLKFIILMSVFIMMSMMLVRLYGYQFNLAADARFVTEQDLNGFFGWYTAVTSVAGLLFVATLRRYMLMRHGILKNMLAAPGVSMTGLVCIILFPAFPVVVAVEFARDLANYLQFAYDFFLQGMSDFVRNRTATLLSGPVTTIGGLIGSGMLILVTWLLGDGAPVAQQLRIFSTIALALVLLQLLVTLRLRAIFFPLLRSAAASGDFKTRLRAIEAMAEAQFSRRPDSAPVMDVVMDESAPLNLRLSALRTAAAIKDPSCLHLIDKLLSYPEIELRKEAARTIAAFDLRPDKPFESGFLYETLLDDLRSAFAREHDQDALNDLLDALVSLGEPSVVRFLEEGLKTTDSLRLESILHAMRRFSDSAIIEVVKPFITHSSPRVRAQAVVALWRFPTERAAEVGVAFQSMIDAKQESEDFQSGLYLIGTLRLKQHAELARGALRSDSSQTRLIAAIALLKIDDQSGDDELERVLRTGDAEEVRLIRRLSFLENLPAKQKAHVDALIHKWHLHYPKDLPVSEPLRVRLHDIPKECLERLLPFYADPISLPDKKKMVAILENPSFPEVKGSVVLMGLDGPWHDLAVVALLANGYVVRESAQALELLPHEVVVGNDGDSSLPPDAVTLSDDGLSVGLRVAKSHYAPSELIVAVSRAFAKVS